VCRKKGKQFGEVMDFFVVGADEACLMSNAHNNVKIVGSAKKRTMSAHQATIAALLQSSGLVSAMVVMVPQHS
jgi:hypothetical protein